MNTQQVNMEETARQIQDAKDHIENVITLLIEMTMITGLKQEEIEEIIIKTIRKRRFQRNKVN